MTMQTDGSGQLYKDVGNIRVTYISSQARDQSKNWSGQDVIRVNAYKTDPSVSQALHPGAELPIADAATFISLISALCAVYNAGRAATSSNP